MVHVSILISPYVEEIIEGLKILFETGEDEGTYPGYLRTVALCTEVNETRQMSIATSKDVWPPRSFLQSWVIRARESRFGARGSQASNNLIEEVNTKVQTLAIASGVSVKQAVLDLAYADYAGKDLKKLYAQAYDARNFVICDRCWRCRVTFGFNWLCHEINPTCVDSEEVRDFEGVP